MSYADELYPEPDFENSELLSWDDPDPYLWQFEVRQGADFGNQLLYMTAWPIFLMILIYIACIFFGSSHPISTFYVGWGVLFVGVILVFLGRFQALKLRDKVYTQPSMIYTVALPVLFYLMFSPVSFIREEFNMTSLQPNALDPDALSMNHLVNIFMLFLDNALHIILFDGPELFELKLSQIKALGRRAQTAVFLLRLLIAIGLVNIIVTVWRAFFLENRFYGSVKELYERCVGMKMFVKYMYVMKLSSLVAKPFRSGVNDFMYFIFKKALGFGSWKLNEGEIEEKLGALDGSQQYHWRIHRVGMINFFAVLYIVLISIMLPLGLGVACYLAFKFFSKDTGIGLAYLFILMTFLSYIFNLLSVLCRINLDKTLIRGELNSFYEENPRLGIFARHLSTFLLVARYLQYWLSISSLGALVFLMVVPGTEVHSGFQGAFSLKEWSCFLGDNILKVLLFDLLEIYRISLTSIKMVSQDARTSVFIFRIFLCFGLISLVVDIWRLIFRDFHFQGTVNDCFWICLSQPYTMNMELELIGKVEDEKDAEEWPISNVLSNVAEFEK